MSDMVQDEIVVRAGPDTIMDVIADFDAYPEWQDEFKEVEVLEADEDGWGTKVRFVVDAKIMRAVLVLQYSYAENEMRWRLVDGEGVRRNDGAYTLRDLGDGTTLVRYEVEIVPAVPVPGMLRRQATKRIVEGALKAMKHRVESLPG